MDEKVLKKIKIYKMLTWVFAILTFIDVIVPDFILAIDEVLLASLTTLFVLLKNICEKKVKELENNGSSKLNVNEVTEVTKDVLGVVKSIKKNKKC